MKRVLIAQPAVLLAADSSGDNKGKLFEDFTALLFSLYGYTDPTDREVRVTSRGVEIDIRTEHALTGQGAIAECKAYTANVAAEELDKFYGKLTVARFDDPNLVGYFVALPGLTGPGQEQAEAIKANDPNFKVINAIEVVSMLQDQGVIPATSKDLLMTDTAVVVSREGVYVCAKVLDDVTRLPQHVAVWGTTPVPDPVIAGLAELPYTAGVPVLAVGEAPSGPDPGSDRPEQLVIAVAGSTADFDYQPPASPKFFVGRREAVASFRAALATLKGRSLVLVVNAKSGSGKSSMALRFKGLVESDRGAALVVDSRTATSPEFVWAALRKLALEAEGKGLLTLPTNTSFGSLASALATLDGSKWTDVDRPAMLFFDQFENVFANSDLTREFRDLALAIRDLSLPIILGFAWKTDLVSWTEGHPYELRDAIRDSAEVILVPPLGPSDIDTLLRRLEKEIGESVDSDLRRRLREFSQGLPWLFKKLAAHIISEIRAGTSQTDLVSQTLNVQSLFDSDIGELTPEEEQGLRTIARMAPVLVSDAIELVDRNRIQALLNRRLVVQVGERLDTYWDIFRDYLNTGTIPVRDTYILRQTPGAVAKLLRSVVEAGGSLAVVEAARTLEMSEGTVFNCARDLREMGVLATSPGEVKLHQSLMEVDDPEAAIRTVISSALRRHRAYQILTDAVEERSGAAVPTSVFAAELPGAWPAVEAAEATWGVYARAFIHWFRYAGLASVTAAGVALGESDEELQLLEGDLRTQRPGAFPQGPAGPAVEIVELIDGHRSELKRPNSTVRKALGDLVALGFATLQDEGLVAISVREMLDSTGTVRADLVRERMCKVPGGPEAIALLESNPATAALDIGQILKEAQGTSWAKSTMQGNGRYFRSWARLAGVKTTRT